MTITTPAIDTSIGPSDTYGVALRGTWSAANLGNGQVYLQVSDSGGAFGVPAIRLAPDNLAFEYTLTVASLQTMGERNGTLTVRACKDSTCSQPYDNASSRLAYRLTIDGDRLDDWDTLQGNAAHNGYAPVRIDATKLTKTWEWQAPLSGNQLTVLGFPITGADGVYFRTRRNDSRDSILALNETDGSVRWQKTINGGNFATRPAYNAGKVYYGVTDAVFYGHGLAALDANSGATLFVSPALRYPASEMSPVPHNGSIFLMASDAADVARGGLAKVDGETGELQWPYTLVFEREGMPQTTTPALDESSAYFHGSLGLHVVGTQGASGGFILPYPPASVINPSSLPVVLGNRGNALTSYFSYEPTLKSFLASYHFANKSLEWTTPLDYAIYPAVAKGTIYAARADNNQVSLHALDETTGQVLWTWMPPTADAQIEVSGNIMATRNLVFFSTGNPYTRTSRTWAIDMATRQQVWSFPAASEVAISASGTLYLSFPGSVVAFKLH